MCKPGLTVRKVGRRRRSLDRAGGAEVFTQQTFQLAAGDSRLTVLINTAGMLTVS